MSQNKAIPHPYGSTVVPGFEMAGPKPSAVPVPGVPSVIPGTIGVAGAAATRVSGTPTPVKQPSKIAQKFDELLDAFADLVADRVMERLAPFEPRADVEDLNRESFSIGEPEPNMQAQAFKPSRVDTSTPLVDDNGYSNNPSAGTGPMLPSESGDAMQMHTAMEQALREREQIKMRRFAPGPLGFLVLIEGHQHVTPDMSDDDRYKGWRENYRTCTLYAQPYGGGYTDGAKPNEYVLLCDGRRVYRSREWHAGDWENNADRMGPARFQPGYWSIGVLGSGEMRISNTGYSAGLTFDEVLAAVDAMRSASWGADS